MFSFGHNVWKTASFMMDVDINRDGLRYNLYKKQPYFKGCSIVIDLYENPIGSWTCPSIDSLKDKIKAQIEYIDTPIFFNGELISFSSKKLKWSYEDNMAYYLFGIGDGLKIYNLGAYVKTIPTYQAGVSGIVVSKKMLKVNFARNDIQSDCSIYLAIQEVVKENRAENAKKTYKTLSEDERKSLLFDLRDGSQDWGVIRKARILKTSQGKFISLNMFFKDNKTWTFAPDGDQKADRIAEQGLAICFSSSIIDSLNYCGKKELFFNWLLKEHYKQLSGMYWIKSVLDTELKNKTSSYIPFNKKDLKGDELSIKTLCESFNSTYQIFDKLKYTAVEKRVISVLSEMHCWEGRTLCIGSSGEAVAWTDGSSYIALDRLWLSNFNFNYNRDINQLFTTLCHELAHSNDSQGTHNHGYEFYEKYYEITSQKYSPLIFMTDFCKKINDSKYMARVEAREKKKKEKIEKLQERLGISTLIK
jgi:hypothetical protein